MLPCAGSLGIQLASMLPLTPSWGILTTPPSSPLTTASQDSGGFQMVSLVELAEVTEEGVQFQSPYDGGQILLSPEKSIEIQNALGKCGGWGLKFAVALVSSVVPSTGSSCPGTPVEPLLQPGRSGGCLSRWLIECTAPQLGLMAWGVL